jgi:hypothetical protein
MTFYEAHVLVMNTLARLFGGLALVAGSFFLVSAYVHDFLPLDPPSFLR